ncbi:hypothetical protein L798_09723 [Zootermopsis nevadensis]|uniref:Uncharacterized protein n=1 Tax=Zootermopsis nevadensis TaxID=136037 RepID=A0A067QYQ8_ZOONE|nr:hypothetical protein L798_09723 [Zootermopsis nevadensis]
METVVLRVLLLVVLFILLTGDYTSLFNHILQQGDRSVRPPPDVSRTDDAVDIQCEYLASFLRTTSQCNSWKGVNWIQPAHERGRWRIIVYTVMNLRGYITFLGQLSEIRN